MATEYLRSSRWPMWHFVQATLNREDLDADQLLDSLPRVGGRWFAKPYRLAWWDDGPTENSRPGLTIAAVHHVPDLLPVMGQPFLLVLRKLVEIQRNLPLSPDEIKTVAYTPDDIRRVLPSISDLFMARLPDILSHEPPTWGAFLKMSPDGSWWQRQLNREIVRYKGADLRDVRSYVQRVSELMAPEPLFGNSVFQSSGTQVNIGPSVTASEPEASAATLSPDPPVAVAPVYVDESLIKELEAKNTTSEWDVTKLVQLLRELNSNFAAENPYACLALLRAILDHVPPVLKAPDFDQAASNFKWGQTNKSTDRVYAMKLKDARALGDDALHRQIRRKSDLIGMEDVPPRRYLNAILPHVIDAL